MIAWDWGGVVVADISQYDRVVLGWWGARRTYRNMIAWEWGGGMCGGHIAICPRGDWGGVVVEMRNREFHELREGGHIAICPRGDWGDVVVRGGISRNVRVRMERCVGGGHFAKCLRGIGAVWWWR